MGCLRRPIPAIITITTTPMVAAAITITAMTMRMTILWGQVIAATTMPRVKNAAASSLNRQDI